MKSRLVTWVNKLLNDEEKLKLNPDNIKLQAEWKAFVREKTIKNILVTINFNTLVYIVVSKVMPTTKFWLIFLYIIGNKQQIQRNKEETTLAYKESKRICSNNGWHGVYSLTISSMTHFCLQS